MACNFVEVLISGTYFLDDAGLTNCTLCEVGTYSHQGVYNIHRVILAIKLSLCSISYDFLPSILHKAMQLSLSEDLIRSEILWAGDQNCSQCIAGTFAAEKGLLWGNWLIYNGCFFESHLHLILISHSYKDNYLLTLISMQLKLKPNWLVQHLVICLSPFTSMLDFPFHKSKCPGTSNCTSCAPGTSAPAGSYHLTYFSQNRNFVNPLQYKVFSYLPKSVSVWLAGSFWIFSSNEISSIRRIKIAKYKPKKSLPCLVSVY